MMQADVPASPKSGLSPQSPAYDLFLTHAWGKNNKNHKRVARVNAALKKLGFTTWFDDDRMVGQIRQQMCTGIGNSRAVLVFITADYMEKVNSEQDNNCQLEFNYAVDKKKSKLMIPIVMEKDFLDPEKWDGPLKMCLGTKMFYAMAQDSDMDSMLSGLLKELAGIGITPSQSGQAPASPTQQAKVVDVAQETKLPSQSGQAPASPTQQAKVVDVAQETKLPSQSGQAPASPTQQAKVVDVAQETKLKVEQPAGDITAEVRLAKEEKAGNVARSLPPPTMPKAPQQAAVTAPQSVTVTTARTENKKERPASIYYELSGHQLHRYATEVSTE
eukprot:jgi/Mesvir1/17577/Mv08812-RA.7